MMKNNKLTKTSNLAEQVGDVAKRYLNDLNTKSSAYLYQFILTSVEPPLLRLAMQESRYNQSRAARLLGISRGTLRAKLAYYFPNEFIGEREKSWQSS